MEEKQLIALEVWNYKVISSMRNLLWVRQTNTGLAPVIKYHEKLEQALEFLEQFEHAKHTAIIEQLAKHAAVCKAEEVQLQAIPWWKFWLTYNRLARLKVLWCSYSVYQNAMAIVIDTLPSDIPQAPEPPAQEPPAPEGERELVLPLGPR